MIRTHTFFTRLVSLVCVLALANWCVPMGAIATLGTPITEHVQKLVKDRAEAAKELAKERAASASRELTDSEQDRYSGKANENPYLAGQAKWDVVYKGVDLMSGNYSMSSTDLSFENGYGIPVNVTRSYSSNNGDEGPFGKGWQLSADVRSTAGGLLKKPGSPVMSVPTRIKERPSTETDPNVAVQPVAAVTSSDAGGTDETVQKDVDGVLTTPPWDNNRSDCQYEAVTFNSQVYQVLAGDTVTTLDGTVYTYGLEGTYPNGQSTYGNPSAPLEPANVLKVTTATDRQGNLTTYSYGSGWVTFNTVQGQVTEHPLTSVSMPNGHVITFVWGDGSNGHPTNRVWKIQDNGSTPRVATYSYDSNGLLISFTTPGGRTTTYGYGNAYSSQTNNPPPVATMLLTSITDPRGMTTGLTYMMDGAFAYPYRASVSGPVCERVIQPNGTEFYFCGAAGGVWNSDGGNDWPSDLGDGELGVTMQWEEWAGGVNSGIEINNGAYQSVVTVAGDTLQFGFYGVHGSTDANFEQGSTILPQHHLQTYSLDTQDLLDESIETAPHNNQDLSTSRAMRTVSNSNKVDTASSFNFMGKPLSTTVTESIVSPSIPVTVTRSATTQYAYWDGTKYFQQKAVVDPGGRVSFTDYYTSSAAAGSRGQTYEVFDPAHATFSPLPPTSGWQYNIAPVDATKYSAQFVYDTKGRATDVYKLQNSTTTPYTYVRTNTVYAADSSPAWGQATQVTEDYGGINRVTQNSASGYTAWGKPSVVTDAAGHTFQTVYDNDENVLSVTRIDNGLNQTITSYTIGSTNGAPENGMPTSVTDGLSGVTQSIVYGQYSGGRPSWGQVVSVAQSGGGDSGYSCSYTYDIGGSRSAVFYFVGSTEVGAWGYQDYSSVGESTKPSRVFQTLVKLDSGGNRTAEEMDYAYDETGRVVEAAFAQTPSGSTRLSNGGFYDGTHLATTRARAHYDYDPQGRVLDVLHYWDTVNSGGTGYTSSAILGNSCTYETDTGLNRGLKLSSTFYGQGGSTAYVENYGYDANLDYLSSFTTTDGQANSSQSWTYDAAGNRIDTVTDNLNRPVSIGGTSVSSDILGNRLTFGSQSYGWDAINRMTSFTNGSGTTNYTYRADGLRVFKSGPSTSTLYRYDGQMGFEDVSATNGTLTTTDYGLGARGIDYISAVTNGTTTVSYPIFDSHGNMVATLSRGSGAGTYAVSNQRDFGPWGDIRGGSGSGDPKGRYCASLGHKQDDESGLVYMQARYYEPGSGRFLSADSKRQDSNLFAYCCNNPVNAVDGNGRFWQYIIGLLAAFVIGTLVSAGFQWGYDNKIDWNEAIWTGGVAAIVAAVILAPVISFAVASDMEIGEIAGFLGLAVPGSFLLGAFAGALRNCLCGGGAPQPPGGLVGALGALEGDQFLEAFLLYDLDNGS